MASETLPAKTRERFAGGSDEAWGGLPDVLATILKPLASLKLTVACFAMAIFIVLAGTLAQIDKDIWEVMGQYFRTPLAWIPLSIFFPRSIEVPGGFYFPGGFSIGLVMLLNLFAAHAVRFKVQASGTRLLAGLGVIAAGAAMTWLVIASGSNPEGLQAVPSIQWSTLWLLSKVGLTALWLANVHAVIRMDRSRKLERILLGATATLLGALLIWLWSQADAVALGDSSMRILWQLIKGGLASLVLLAGAIMVFRKRAGIVLLHAGVALMMLNELVVHTLHVEAQMQIREGETVNFVQDVRKLELAVVDTSNPESDQVVVVPQSILGLHHGASHPLVRDAKLPFDVQVVRFVQNSDLRRAKAGEKNPADKGFGVERIVEEVRPGAGTDAGGSIDMSAAYVKFLKKDSSEPLGTYLLGLYQSFADLPETVTVDGKEYEVYLRFKRNYKPYSMHLIDVRFDRYMGTSTPRNYSSDVRLVDPSRNVDRTLKIWMNNPLRYAGETFYQSNFSQDRAGNEITGLQVVTNTGWMIPYVACMIVATGLLAHFLIVLDRFLRRTGAMEPAAAAPGRRSRKAAAASTPSMSTWVVPLAAVVVFGGWLGSKARPPSPPRPGSGRMNLYEFGKLPLVYEGRVKPFDTLARNSLRILSDREILVDNADEKRPAIEWLLDVITDPGKAAEYRVFRIQNLEVLDTLGLKRRKYYRYAIAEFQPRLGEFQVQLKRAQDTPEAELSVFQKKLLELSRRLNLYMMLGMAFDQAPI
ncbi:MAG: cytochrome c biogenesis protein ResB, partial [Pirellulales bacterium]